jgi:hypothetical protein
VAGAVTLEDLAEELRREVPQALVVTASLRSDPEYVQRFAEALGPMALALHLPVGFMGMGAWPSDVPGATRLTRADQSLQWLQEIPRTRRAVMGDEGAAAV